MSADANAYSAVLSDLRTKRDQLNAAIQALEALMPKAAEEAKNRAAETGSDALTGMSIADAAIAVLGRHGRQMHVSEITAAITNGGLAINSDDAVNTVGSILSRRAHQRGDVARGDRRGMWRVSERSAEENEAEEQAQDESDRQHMLDDFDSL